MNFRTLVATAAAAAVTLLCAPVAAYAVPLVYTFENCSVYSDCGGGTTVLAKFSTDDTIAAPAVPAPGTRSAIQTIAASPLAGSWDAVGIQAFNVAGSIGSLFVFQNLAVDSTTRPVFAIAPVFTSALALSWPTGTYTGLGGTDCYDATCSIASTIRFYARLTVEPAPATTVPEPPTGVLALAALAIVGGLRLGARARR